MGLRSGIFSNFWNLRHSLFLLRYWYRGKSTWFQIYDCFFIALLDEKIQPLEAERLTRKKIRKQGFPALTSYLLWAVFLCRTLGAKWDNKRSFAYRISMLYLSIDLKKERNLLSKIFRSKKPKSKAQRNLLINFQKGVPRK